MKTALKYTTGGILILVWSTLSIAQTTVKYSQSDVPVEFQVHYGQLDAKLDSLNNHILNAWDNTRHPVVFSTELLAASPNRGDIVLEPHVFEAVKFNLDAFQALGVTGVSMDIKYPVIVPRFPKSDEYIEFFRKVTEEIRKREFTLLIAIQTVFTDSIFGRQDVDYSGLTLEQYKSEKRGMAETVIQELHPDYLTIEAEPTTQEANTGLDFSVENVTDIVNFILDGLDRQTTLVGAGAATWDNMAYNQSLAENTSIDYLDIHIYPIQNDLVIDRMETIYGIAQAYSKKIVIGESWLYKISEAELGNPSFGPLDIYPRDVYDFWIPLDEKFIQLMVNLSHHLKCDFTSLFWMRYFWGYIAYNDTTSALHPTQRYSAVDQIVGSNMLSGNLTPTGQTYQGLIQEDTHVDHPDNPAPQKFILYQNYPNPFNPTTTIHFWIPHRQHVTLNIFDILGREIVTLIEGKLESGSHSVVFNATNIPSGLYVYRIQSGNAIEQKKMVLMK